MGNVRDFVIRRILYIIPTLLGISLLTFTIIHLVPGGPLNFLLTQIEDITPADIEYLNEKMGLNKPIYIQYLLWLKCLLTGDLGTSYISHIPIAETISQYWMNTLKLSLASMSVSLLIAIPIGVISAVKKDSIIDNLSRLISLSGVSMPNFWTGILAIYIFSLRLNLLPVFGMKTIGATYPNFLANLSDQLLHMILPTLVAAFSSTALTTRLVRGSMLDVLNQEYIKTARAKGVKERVVVYKHALRNALLPVVTVVGLSFGFILSGSVTLETIFAWPGLGRFVVEATFMRDYSAIMAMTMIISTTVVLSTIITDIAYGLLDPRIRY